MLNLSKIIIVITLVLNQISYANINIDSMVQGHITEVFDTLEYDVTVTNMDANEAGERFRAQLHSLKAQGVTNDQIHDVFVDKMISPELRSEYILIYEALKFQNADEKTFADEAIRFIQGSIHTASSYDDDPEAAAGAVLSIVTVMVLFEVINRPHVSERSRI